MKYFLLRIICTVKDAGHAIHVEKPTLFATMIEEHIINVIKYEEVISYDTSMGNITYIRRY